MKLFTHIKTVMVSTLLLTMVVGPVLALPSQAYADVNKSKQYACQGITLAGGGNCQNSGDEARVTSLFGTIVNILSVIVGVAAVIMIILAGFKYVTSGGDANSIASAKNTLIYAIVGLIIVSLAQFMVHFILSKV